MSNGNFNTTYNDSLPGKDHHSQQKSTVETGINYYDFEQQYLLLRSKEYRVYTDEELTSLPDIGKSHPHHKEWLLRKHSFKMLTKYLKNKKKFLDILEVGCGNGWLTNRLSLHLNCQVTGLDINRPELEQAARAFQHNTECEFIHGDIRSEILADKKFDILLFAASLQYFPSLDEIFNAALNLLKTGGEILIIDTHFYKEMELAKARQRSKSYFASLGVPKMSAMYFHHSFNGINNFHPVILYDPYSYKNRFFRSGSPFYQFCIHAIGGHEGTKALTNTKEIKNFVFLSALVSSWLISLIFCSLNHQYI